MPSRGGKEIGVMMHANGEPTFVRFLVYVWFEPTTLDSKKTHQK